MPEQQDKTGVGKLRLVHLVRLHLVTYVTLTKSNP